MFVINEFDAIVHGTISITLGEIYIDYYFPSSPICAVDSGVDFAMDEDEEYN